MFYILGCALNCVLVWNVHIAWDCSGFGVGPCLWGVHSHSSILSLKPDPVRVQEQQMSVSGRNWGDAHVENSSLVFKADKKTSFSIALPDVSQVEVS